jgi:hypothetical protein
MMLPVDSKVRQKVQKKSLSAVMLFGDLERWTLFAYDRFQEIVDAQIFSEAIFVVNRDDEETIKTVRKDVHSRFSNFPLRVLFHNTNNIPKGRNLGVGHTETSIIMIWDDDDSCNSQCLRTAFKEIFLPSNLQVLELPLNHEDGSPFHPQPSNIMPQVPYPQREDLLVVGMVHTPFFVTRDLLLRIPFTECMALRGEWFHWSTELWRAGIPIVCMKGIVAFECRPHRDIGENASARASVFSYYHLLVSLLHMIARYDIDPESEHGQVIRKRYLDKYHPSDAKTVWHALAEIGSHIRNGTKVSVEDVICMGNSFGDLLGNAYRKVAECVLVCKNAGPKARYDVGPFEIFSHDREKELQEILSTLAVP